MKKFSKMKVHWWTYKHSLFVSYLTSVAFGYGWISDIKFHKFSDEDGMWIFKIFFGYGSRVKKSISAHFCRPVGCTLRRAGGMHIKLGCPFLQPTPPFSAARRTAFLCSLPDRPSVQTATPESSCFSFGNTALRRAGPAISVIPISRQIELFSNK